MKKQNKDREELLDKVERLVEEYAVNWEDWDCLPERLVEFIETHTQKKVEEEREKCKLKMAQSNEWWNKKIGLLIKGDK